MGAIQVFTSINKMWTNNITLILMSILMLCSQVDGQQNTADGSERDWPKECIPVCDIIYITIV